MTPPGAPTTWHCQPEMAASNPRENGSFVSRLTVLGEQAWAHRRAFPRPHSSLRDSCRPLETPCGHPLASIPGQMVALLPFLSWACQLLRSMPSPVVLPEAFPPNLLREAVSSISSWPVWPPHMPRHAFYPFCMRATCELSLPALGLLDST